MTQGIATIARAAFSAERPGIGKRDTREVKESSL